MKHPFRQAVNDLLEKLDAWENGGELTTTISMIRCILEESLGYDHGALKREHLNTCSGAHDGSCSTVKVDHTAPVGEIKNNTFTDGEATVVLHYDVPGYVTFTDCVFNVTPHPFVKREETEVQVRCATCAMGADHPIHDV